MCQSYTGAATSGQSAIESCFSDSRPSSQNGANEHNERQSWHRGLYSLRLGGAEFITQNTTASSPKHLGESATDLPHVLNAEDSSNSDSDEEAGTTEEEKAAGRTGVMWITGHHAVAMERADDETLIRALNTCFDSFPALDIPRNFKVWDWHTWLLLLEHKCQVHESWLPWIDICLYAVQAYVVLYSGSVYIVIPSVLFNSTIIGTLLQ